MQTQKSLVLRALPGKAPSYPNYSCPAPLLVPLRASPAFARLQPCCLCRAGLWGHIPRGTAGSPMAGLGPSWVTTPVPSPAVHHPRRDRRCAGLCLLLEAGCRQRVRAEGAGRVLQILVPLGAALGHLAPGMGCCGLQGAEHRNARRGNVHVRRMTRRGR